MGRKLSSAKSIKIEADLYDYLMTQGRKGEFLSDIIRRLIKDSNGGKKAL